MQSQTCISLSFFSTLHHASLSSYLYKKRLHLLEQRRILHIFWPGMEHIYQFQHWLFFIVLGVLLSLSLSVKSNDFRGSNDRRGINFNARNRTAFSRKLLLSPDIGDGTNRIRQDCSKDDIVVFQGSTNPLPSGVPAYTVEIFNACVSGCNIAEIHVSCGWFSSVRLVNPRVFRRLYYDDCLVNDGQPLGPGQSLSFQYANSFSYPLSVSSVSCF